MLTSACQHAHNDTANMPMVRTHRFSVFFRLSMLAEADGNAFGFAGCSHKATKSNFDLMMTPDGKVKGSSYYNSVVF